MVLILKIKKALSQGILISTGVFNRVAIILHVGYNNYNVTLIDDPMLTNP
jgi:hypothetical protein